VQISRFQNDKDRIVTCKCPKPVPILTEMIPQTKGFLWVWACEREPERNFYKGVQAGLEIVNGLYMKYTYGVESFQGRKESLEGKILKSFSCGTPIT